MTIDLSHILPDQVWPFLLTFARVGAMMMLLPVIGEMMISPRFRLSIALAVSLLLTPMAATMMPPMPPTIFALAGLLISEIVIGIALGGALRLVMSALQVAGSVIAMQTGLGFAMAVDPTQGAQSALISTFLTLLAITLIFASGMHHLLIGAVHGSYLLFAPGVLPDSADLLELVVRMVSGAFLLGIQMSAPFLVFGLVFYLGTGVISKMMPQVQIFFLTMPANILIGFMLLMSLLALMMTWFLDRFAADVGSLAG